MANKLIKYVQSTDAATGLNTGKLIFGGSFPATTSTSMYAVANDWSGNLFVADIESNCIYKITESGQIALLAGSPNQDGYVNGTGTAARFQNPKGITCDRSGNVYVADTGNNRIRKIDTNGKVTTIAGGFNAPLDVATAPNGDIIVADTGNHRIYRVKAGGQTLLVAGSSVGDVCGDVGGVKIKGSAAKFSSPSSVTVDNTGNIYVADRGNYKIKVIHPDGWVKVFAGSTIGNVNGVAAAAQFTSLLRVKANRSGCLYVIDAVGTFNRVKKVDANGNVSTYGTLLRSETAFGIAVTPADKVFVVVATSGTEVYESSSSSSETGSSVSSASSEKSTASTASSVSSASSEKSTASSVSSASSEKSSVSSVSSVSSASSEKSSVSSNSSSSQSPGAR